MTNPQRSAKTPDARTPASSARTTAAGAERLDTAECWRLLEGERLGRLALSDADGVPDVFPVNFIAFEGALYVRTAPGTKLDRVRAQPATAFEIDGGDDSSRWSVVIRGTASLVRDDAEFRASGAGRLVPWSPGRKPFAVKITPGSVSGRRFPARDVAPATHESQVVDPPVQAGAPEPAPSTGAPRRPSPIPHRPPLDDWHR